MCVFIYTHHKCVCMCRSEVNLMCLPRSLSTGCYETRSPPWTQGLPIELARWPEAPEIFLSASPRRNLHALPVFMWVLGIQLVWWKLLCPLSQLRVIYLIKWNFIYLFIYYLSCFCIVFSCEVTDFNVSCTQWPSYYTQANQNALHLFSYWEHLLSLWGIFKYVVWEPSSTWKTLYSKI